MNTNIRQHDISDCAAACIASVARHHGFSFPLTVIREASGTSGSGTTLKGVMDAFGELGFSSATYKSDEKDTCLLAKVPMPVILHVLTRQGDLHFMVLYGIGKKKATLMDPAVGSRIRLGLDELKEIWSGYLITASPVHTIAAPREKTRQSSLFSYARLLSWKEYLSMAIGSVAYIVAGVCTSLFLQHIIDDVIPDGSRESLMKTGALMVTLMAFMLAVGYERMIFSLRVNIKMDSRLTLGYLDRLFRLPLSFFTRRGPGELHSRLSDASKIRSFLTEGMVTIVTSILILAVSFALMFTYHWRLALMMLTFIPVFLALYLVAGKVNRKLNRGIMESSAAFEEKTVEGIGSARLIKHFGGEGAVFRVIEKRYTDLAWKLYRGGRCVGIFASSSDAVSKMMTVTLLTAGAAFIFRGSLSVGELVSFYSLAAYFSAPLSRLVEMNDTLSEARISAERLGDIMNLDSEQSDGFGLPPENDADIIFDKVTFSYAGCPVLLKDFCATIPHGKITAIQGESGCGKSSLAALLMRDYKVSGGKILLGSTDISLISLQEWRRHVSIIPQEPELMNCNILENITCLEKSPDIKRVAEILDSLGLHDFVTGLPMGLLTPIGERGCALSGGQKQRISLARALYRDPRILILDEATSSLDDMSQRYVLDTVARLRDEGRTIVMITHKADNVAIADKIIRL